jgi:hypothetical protein
MKKTRTYCTYFYMYYITVLYVIYIFDNNVSDGIICVHDMKVYNFPIVATVERTKGASLFTLDIQVKINNVLESHPWTRQRVFP